MYSLLSYILKQEIGILTVVHKSLTQLSFCLHNTIFDTIIFASTPLKPIAPLLKMVIIYSVLDSMQKKVVSNSPGLVHFAIWIVNSVLNLPDGQVKYFLHLLAAWRYEISLLVLKNTSQSHSLHSLVKHYSPLKEKCHIDLYLAMTCNILCMCAVVMCDVVMCDCHLASSSVTHTCRFIH